MGLARSSLGVVAFAVWVASASAVSAQQGPCAGIACGGHGVCLSEGDTPLCFCDAGYEASGTRCAPEPRRPPIARPGSAGLRIVSIALAESDRPLDRVGVQRMGAPGPLARFVPGGALWCSDFVSWVYRAAGVPFTGGYEGGWMLRTNEAIKRWYERRGAWVAHDSPGYASFRPRPGDYLRIRTSSWGHSAIVRYVDGDTLYAIEGNSSGHVRRTRYLHFRRHERIDGFGLTTDPERPRPHS